MEKLLRCGHRWFVCLLLMAVGLLVPGGVRGQLIVTPGTEFPANWTADSLVRNVLLGTGVTVSNVRFNGHAGILNNGSEGSGMIGMFTTGREETDFGMEAGLILANGCVDSAVGMNTSDATTAWECYSNYSCPLLDDILGYDSYGWAIGANDVAALEFDFVPTSDSIIFEYIFGSEEYPEFVCSSFNDVFGFFLTGQNPDAGQPSYNNKNLALLPNSNIPITINNVNGGYTNYFYTDETECNLSNSEYYVDNTGGRWVKYDGYTVPLTAAARVVPNTVYHLLIAIADASDYSLDSGVFLKANSLSAVIDTIYDTVCYGECYQFVDTTVCDAGVYVHGEGRSQMTLVLQVRDQHEVTYQSDTISMEQLPWSYEGRSYDTQVTNDSVMLADRYGCDSMVLYSLYLTYATYDTVTICEGEVYEMEGQQYSKEGNYVVRYTTEQGCDSSHYLHLEVAKKPEARLHVEPDVADVENREIKVYDQSKRGKSRSWYLDEVFFGGEAVMEFTYPIERDSVRLTLVSESGPGCRDTAETIIYYDRCALWVPNVFSPEIEGNDRFCPVSECLEDMEMWIYNREGMQVFHTTEVGDSWDGTNQRTGVKCVGGSYVYTINYRMTNHPITKKTKTGMVMLLR